MPKRRTQRRFNTEDVQGEGSYVVLSSMRVGERRNCVAKLKEDDFSALDMVTELLVTHVVEWNWVGDDDSPLPLPKEDPTIIEHLTDYESEVLADFLINPSAKN